MKRQSKKSAHRTKLPRRLRPLFWDYNFEILSWEKNRDLITARVLASGGWETIVWLRSHMGDRALAEWIQRRQGRGLSVKQLSFWELILELSPKEVNSWLEAAGRIIWEKRMNP